MQSVNGNVLSLRATTGESLNNERELMKSLIGKYITAYMV